MIDKNPINPAERAKHIKATRQKQKEHLKTLVENSSVSRVRNTSRIVKYGAASFKRNIWLSIAATLVMTVTLVILLTTIGASLILSSTADTMRQKIDITIFFQPGTDPTTLSEMAETMRADNNVSSVNIASSEDEFNALIEENKDNSDLLAAFQDETMYQTMLGTMPATMRIKVYDANDLTSVRNIVETNATFQANLSEDKDPTYDANQAEIQTINSWATIAKNGGLILGAIFIVISVLVIFNTIRMAIFSRREEIYMMKLVGADTSFIRGPFLIEAQISGIISGLLASTLAYVGFRFIAPNLASYGIDISLVSDLMATNKLVLVYLGVIGVGILIGTISARLAMQKYLK